ncbi:hypothetical protein [Vibrio lentus]|uniref:hypothetical protein n=1 Tax=Vibrio lentus TaxID=136468 RepID=UPI00178CAA3F|nr:hypothetical protein [Vibrio lentus]MDN3631426.1 hypothetical protein [Vibrio lentus]
MEKVVTINDVFRTSRGLPKNYVTRKSVDEKFINALSLDSHIVVHGSSKQGKTSLRKWNLQDDDFIVLTCSNNWKLEDLHISILKEAGYLVSVSESKTHKGTSKISVGFDIPFLAGPKANCDVSKEKARQVNKKNLELDPSDVNDIIRALHEINFTKFIVIEDFHYLPESTQIDFSVALKAFHESSDICFIIVGVWLEVDRLTVHNGDLTGRVISINADLWSGEDFDMLFFNSESLLNISFSDDFKEEVKQNSNGSIFLVQQLCLLACESQDVNQTQPETVIVGEHFKVAENIKDILGSHNARYYKFLTEFSAGFDQTELDLYKWILYAIIDTELTHLEKGLTVAAARRCIARKHPKSSAVTQRKLTQFLRRAVDLQLRHSIKPIVIEYDANTMRIKIVDRSFLLWREYQDKEELYDYADLTDDLHSPLLEI